MSQNEDRCFIVGDPRRVVFFEIELIEDMAARYGMTVPQYRKSIYHRWDSSPYLHIVDVEGTEAFDAWLKSKYPTEALK